MKWARAMELAMGEASQRRVIRESICLWSKGPERSVFAMYTPKLSADALRSIEFCAESTWPCSAFWEAAKAASIAEDSDDIVI